jgi:hypothetical protein
MEKAPLHYIEETDAVNNPQYIKDTSLKAIPTIVLVQDGVIREGFHEGIYQELLEERSKKYL